MNSDVWIDELGGGHEALPPTPEEKILSFLHIERRCKRLPLEFSYLRSWSMLKDDALFYTTLKKLESEGKVVRVRDATKINDSMWSVPTPPTEELILEELRACLSYDENGVRLNDLQRVMKDRWEVSGDNFWNAFQILVDRGEIVCVDSDSLRSLHTSMWTLGKEDE